jgi:hypothetical protein
MGAGSEYFNKVSTHNLLGSLLYSLLYCGIAFSIEIPQTAQNALAAYLTLQI